MIIQLVGQWDMWLCGHTHYQVEIIYVVAHLKVKS